MMRRLTGRIAVIFGFLALAPILGADVPLDEFSMEEGLLSGNHDIQPFSPDDLKLIYERKNWRRCLTCRNNCEHFYICPVCTLQRLGISDCDCKNRDDVCNYLSKIAFKMGYSSRETMDNRETIIRNAECLKCNLSRACGHSRVISLHHFIKNLDELLNPITEFAENGDSSNTYEQGDLIHDISFDWTGFIPSLDITEYNTETNEHRRVMSINQGFFQNDLATCAFTVTKNAIYIVGGNTVSIADAYSNKVVIFDIKSKSLFKPKNQMLLGRGGAAAAVFKGKLFVGGGMVNAKEEEMFKAIKNRRGYYTKKRGVTVTSTVESLSLASTAKGSSSSSASSPVEGTWKPENSFNVPRYKFTFLIHKDNLFAIGGCNAGGFVKEIEVYTENGWKMYNNWCIERRFLSAIGYDNKLYLCFDKNAIEGEAVTDSKKNEAITDSKKNEAITDSKKNEAITDSKKNEAGTDEIHHVFSPSHHVFSPSVQSNDQPSSDKLPDDKLSSDESSSDSSDLDSADDAQTQHRIVAIKKDGEYSHLLMIEVTFKDGKNSNSILKFDLNSPHKGYEPMVWRTLPEDGLIMRMI